MSSKYPLFRTLHQGKTISNVTKSETIRFITNTFEDHPLYISIPINSVSTDCIIESTDKYDTRKVLFKPGNTNKIGDLLTYKSKYWLITDYFDLDIIPKALIQECNETLKWQDQDDPLGTILSYPCIATRSLLTKLDETYQSGLIFPQAEQYVYVADNEFTQKINNNSRFFLGSQIFDVNGIDDTTDPGIIMFSMKSCGPQGENDNSTLRVCDYIIPSFSLTINNLASGSTTMNIVRNEEVQLEVILKNNNVVASDQIFTYFSDNTSIATISSTGLLKGIALGVANITASWTDSDDNIISTSFALSVVSGVTTTYSIILDGVDSAKMLEYQTYTATVFKNNEIDTLLSLTWIVTNTNGSTPCNYAQISEIVNNRTVKLKMDNTQGSFILKAYLTSYPSNYKNKTITVKSFIG